MNVKFLEFESIKIAYSFGKVSPELKITYTCIKTKFKSSHIETRKLFSKLELKYRMTPNMEVEIFNISYVSFQAVSVQSNRRRS